MPAKSNLKSESISSVNPQDERLPLSRYVLFFAPLLIGLTIDLVTKSLVLGKYPPNRMEPVWWIDNVLGIQTSTNGGALFGMGQGGSHWFALLSLVALVAILFWLFVRKMARSKWLTMTLGMVSAGILGNAYDRVGWGYDSNWNMPEVSNHVRDWIHFKWEGIGFLDPWPNFNIADSLLVCGAILLFFFALFGWGMVEESTESEENESTS